MAEAKQVVVTGRSIRTELFRASIDKLDLVTTLVLDAIVIVVAYAVRAGLMYALAWVVPESERTHWSLIFLDLLADVAVVGTAVLYTLGDFSRRVLRVWRELANDFRREEP